ncbi:hypothetical protein TSUD_360200 [Trifolium subterraneum]|uniref:Uncharacterized protein n=1 Tax=Trifolium subterraneum TaxID=3900 RepID=A0A2Z6NK43_TRISU|nr:hypothetical protein TSUD_360200 [Trifolium subterraneum]
MQQTPQMIPMMPSFSQTNITTEQIQKESIDKYEDIDIKIKGIDCAETGLYFIGRSKREVSNLATSALSVEGFYLAKDVGNEINGFKGSKGPRNKDNDDHSEEERDLKEGVNGLGIVVS